MLCQNCGKEEANVKYTQIINGVKREMSLCEHCAKGLGIDDISFQMPISFSSFLGDFLEPYDHTEFLSGIASPKPFQCERCHVSYEDFLKQGKFGCAECYDVFASKIDPLLKNIHGANRHVGRMQKGITQNNEIVANEDSKQKKTKEVKRENEESKEAKKIQELKIKLQKEIAEERYEDAAKTRDEIKKLEK